MLETELRPVPFVDLRPSHAPLQDALLDEISQLIDSGAFTNGPQVESFERAFASYCGTEHCVGVGSGLDGLRLALIAAGIEPGDEVLVPAMTFVATFEAVAQCGATPVVVDVDDADYCLDVDAAARRVGPRTRAAMPVHLYGQMTDLATFRSTADEHSLVVVEDACQAHGARRDGISPGATTDAAVYSFYPGKNLGAMGDAGAVATNDADLARQLRSLREHGQTAKYVHEANGYTSRLDTIQAIVLLRKLALLDEWNDERRAAADQYRAELDGVGDLRLPHVAANSTPVWHLFVVTTADPAGLASFLASRGISSGRHYPEPPHLSPAWRHLGHAEGDFPVAERLARECLSLPIFPGITTEQVERVTAAVRAYFGG